MLFTCVLRHADWLKAINIYYLTVYATQESEQGLVQCFWLKVFSEAVVEVSVRLQVTEGSPGLEDVSKLLLMATGRTPQFLAIQRLLPGQPPTCQLEWLSPQREWFQSPKARDTILLLWSHLQVTHCRPACFFSSEVNQKAQLIHNRGGLYKSVNSRGQGWPGPLGGWLPQWLEEWTRHVYL